MTRRPSGSGFEPRTREAERRDFFDLRRHAADEVWIGPNAPDDPGFELWYDTDAVSPVGPAMAMAQAAGGTVAAGTSPAVVTLNTPAWPTGHVILVVYTLRVAQTTQNVFDVQWITPGDTSIHQQGSGALTSGLTLTWARQWPTNGASLQFKTVINNWGSQPVSVGNVTQIIAVMI